MVHRYDLRNRDCHHNTTISVCKCVMFCIEIVFPDHNDSMMFEDILFHRTHPGNRSCHHNDNFHADTVSYRHIEIDFSNKQWADNFSHPPDQYSRYRHHIPNFVGYSGHFPDM